MTNRWGSKSGGGNGPSSQNVKWVDLGLIDLVPAVMNGPQTLYVMPPGSFLASIKFTDDPASVPMDSMPSGRGHINGLSLAIGTVKSFGWNGFAWAQGGSLNHSADSGYIVTGLGYGPYAILDTGIKDIQSLVLSAASVGPIQIGLLLHDSRVNVDGTGAGVRVAPIEPWAELTFYDSPFDNTVATPGAIQKCAIIGSGGIWFNDGDSEPSGGISPNFFANTGGYVGEQGTPATVLADSPPSLPLTVVTGVNDQFDLQYWQLETFTMAPGTYTTATQVVNAMAAAVGSVNGFLFSDYVTPSNSAGSILLTMISSGDQENANTIAFGPNDVAAALGFTLNPNSFAGGANGIVWYDTGSDPPTVGKVHAVAEIITLS